VGSGGRGRLREARSAHPGRDAGADGRAQHLGRSPDPDAHLKKESELEVWKKARNGRYVLLKTFPICRWSGQLGPKTRQGDRQAPEGFYAVAPWQMNPNSAYHLSFDLGYPNAFDRAHGRSGSHLMVHGTCSSAGCFAMTDAAVSEIYALAREAFAGGQAAFQVQSFPFRMTAQNMARHRTDAHIAFWRQLKEGSDRFEATGDEPTVSVSAGRYTFAPSSDPAKEAQVAARRAEEEARVSALVADGAAAVRTTYADGGQHASFASLLRRGFHLGEVSRPEALAAAGREIVLIPARAKPVLVATLPPAREQAAPASPAPELSVFAWTPLGYLKAAPGAPVTIAGATPIVSPDLAARPVRVAGS
jgi:murein L,D-transpeptidase YafK